MKKISRLLIEDAAREDGLTKRIRRALPDIPIAFYSGLPALFEADDETGGTLVLARHPGAFVKDFQATPGAPPCGEKYIVTMLNCPYACTYCYLQSYLDHPRVVLFTNTDRLRNEVARALAADRPQRMTTGELGDSLALDRLTGTTLDLLPLFGGSDTLFEVRTKSDEVEHLLTAAHAERLLITWTMGPGDAISREEPGTASLEERLHALSLASAAGIRVGVRLDPVIPHYYRPDVYRDLLMRIIDTAGGNIHRFEIGIVRFTHGLLERVRERNPRSALLGGEYIRGCDGKLRLYRPQRVRVYREISGFIRSAAPGVPVELSMEDRSVWEDAGVPPPAP